MCYDVKVYSKYGIEEEPEKEVLEYVIKSLAKEKEFTLRTRRGSKKVLITDSK